jgi:hypothetical protein
LTRAFCHYLSPFSFIWIIHRGTTNWKWRMTARPRPCAGHARRGLGRPPRHRARALPPAHCPLRQPRARRRTGPLRAFKAALAFPAVNLLSTTVLYGRAGRLTAKNGGFRPGQVYDRRGSRVPSSRRRGRSARTVRPRSPAGALPPDLREATHDGPGPFGAFTRS